MATSIPTNKIVNKKDLLARDEARNRAISINLQRKLVPTRDALWAEHQATIYPDILQVRNIPTLQNLLANELESENQGDSLQTEYLARQNLGTITDEATTEYILDRLSQSDMDNLNQNFPQILKTIKDKYTNMNKNKFIDIVKSKESYSPEFELSERGQRRQNQMDNQYEEVQNTRSRDSELKAMRENDKLSKTPEKGPGGSPLDKARINLEDMYDEKNTDRSPERNPLGKSPKKDRGFFGDIYNRAEPKPTSEDETQILRDVRTSVANLKTMKRIAAYIQDVTKINVPGSYNKPDLIKIATIVGYEKATGRTGSGLKRRRITGRGSPERETDSESDEEVSNGKKVFLNKGKFCVNMDKLRRNILHVYYVSSRASIPSLKRENISTDTRDVLLDILANKYNEHLFNKLKPDEQRLISTFVRIMKIPIDMKEFDDAYQKNYEVLTGEINAGNNNPKVKAELKLYILRGISEGLIPKAQGQLMLYTLSL
jgi:hypothetical protein